MPDNAPKPAQPPSSGDPIAPALPAAGGNTLDSTNFQGPGIASQGNDNTIALRLFRQVGAKLSEANVLLSLGGVKRSANDLDGASDDFQAALALYQHIGDLNSQARALYRLGDGDANQGKKPEALALYQQAAAL